MKKQSSITALLGLRQQDVAMLLQVHPSQWSMYESGKRDLPLAAKQLLAEILTYLKAPETTAKSLSQTKQQQTKQGQQYFEQLLLENEYQQQRLAKELAKLMKKRAAETSLLQLVDFLKSRPTSKGTAKHPC